MARNKEVKNKNNRNYYKRNRDRLLPLYNERSKEYYEKNKELKLTRLKQWRKNFPERAMFSRIKSQAKRRNLEFNISLEDIVIPQKCPVFGTPLTPGLGRHHDNSPSVDRIDNTKGYVKGNIWIISRRANVIKNSGSLDELKLILKALKKKYKEQKEHENAELKDFLCNGS